MKPRSAQSGYIYPVFLVAIVALVALVGITTLRGKHTDQENQIDQAEVKGIAVTTEVANGYSRIRVPTERGTFLIDVIRADVGAGTKVITDSGNTSDCDNNCTTFPLADYAKRNNGFAGINGTYFCPPDYANCANSKNQFHWFVFNYPAKTFLNANKRDYSNAGSVFVFRPSSIQFFRGAQEFGLDTSITGAIGSWPTLVVNREIVLDESVLDDKQRIAKGPRGALGNIGNTVFLVNAKAANIPDLAAIMKALHMDNAVNIDGGGSSAIYYNGYKTGPGRKLPNAIILTR